MKNILSLGILCATFAATAPMLAATIPYPNPGTVAPIQTIVAQGNAGITAYFAGFNANDTDNLQVVDLTNGWVSATFFTNQTTTPSATGMVIGAGNINNGDHLAFIINNVTQDLTFSSQPTASGSNPGSEDGVNHAYLTAFGGGKLPGGNINLPAGTYVGFEDRSSTATGNTKSDLDYNDDSFIFTDISNVNSTPEPSSIALLGTGMLAMAGAVRRRFKA